MEAIQDQFRTTLALLRADLARAAQSAFRFCRRAHNAADYVRGIPFTFDRARAATPLNPPATSNSVASSGTGAFEDRGLNLVSSRP